MRVKKSEALYEAASKLLVGGVDSPVRAYLAVGGTPPFIRNAKGARIYDEDGNQYLDYVCSWGALILGSSHPKVVSAIQRRLPKGTSYGAPTRLETELARLVTSAFPSIEKLRFVNSGTEATMSAIRLARAYTNREKVLKFEGCYHGHVDSLLVKGGSGMATLSTPDSAGVTEAEAENTLIAPYDDLEVVEACFESSEEEIAAVIVEPIAGNMGLIPPRPGFLEGLRSITRKHRSLLIFDEVISGFRVALGGAQQLYRIEADLTCLGKIIGGGLPVGAYGGRGEIMKLVAPEGPVYQAGTLAGNPLAMTAGITTIEELLKKGFYEALERTSLEFQNGLLKAAKTERVPLRLNRVGSMVGLFFTDQEVFDYSSAKSTDTGRYSAFFHFMLDSGIYLPPSPFETIFLSSAHTAADVTRTVRAAAQAFGKTTK
jgi:glutamate-1-semialdehyde 2,1-aminomutase